MDVTATRSVARRLLARVVFVRAIIAMARALGKASMLEQRSSRSAREAYA